MLYVIHCFDRENHLELRQKIRPAHVNYLQQFGARIKAAGPTLDANGAMNGSVIVVECADMSTAQDFAANDPYAQADLFREVLIQAWNKVLSQD
ncbi:MAG: YciI family protein [Desulfuromonadaceae bacterium]|nr:YciI family protein [Desulfuromonas sp.]MDY0184828.1 YciI family protein [Desulfuromonadaceae bacterium]